LGQLGAGEPVEIEAPEGRTVARGLSGYSSGELAAVKGLAQAEVADRLGADRAHPAVHRDELVTHARSRRPALGSDNEH
jgi:glutamate 5-kinase